MPVREQIFKSGEQTFIRATFWQRWLCHHLGHMHAFKTDVGSGHGHSA